MKDRASAHVPKQLVPFTVAQVERIQLKLRVRIHSWAPRNFNFINFLSSKSLNKWSEEKDEMREDTHCFFRPYTAGFLLPSVVFESVLILCDSLFRC